MFWYVIYTKPRNEKKVAFLLQQKGYEVYCPTKEEVRQWSDRKKKIQEPVLKSYIFVKLSNYESESVKVLFTPGIIRFLWWNGKPGVVRECEIEAIKAFLNDYKNSVVTVSFENGQTAIISEGPLKGNHGVIVKQQGRKAYLHIRSLNFDLVATVPVQALMPLS